MYSESSVILLNMGVYVHFWWTEKEWKWKSTEKFWKTEWVTYELL